MLDTVHELAVPELQVCTTPSAVPGHFPNELRVCRIQRECSASKKPEKNLVPVQSFLQFRISAFCIKTNSQSGISITSLPTYSGFRSILTKSNTNATGVEGTNSQRDRMLRFAGGIPVSDATSGGFRLFPVSVPSQLEKFNALLRYLT